MLYLTCTLYEPGIASGSADQRILEFQDLICKLQLRT